MNAIYFTQIIKKKVIFFFQIIFFWDREKIKKKRVKLAEKPRSNSLIRGETPKILLVKTKNCVAHRRGTDVRTCYMSPKMPAKVLRRFFMVSSPSSGPPAPTGPPSDCCWDALRLKKDRARLPAADPCVLSSVERRLRNGLPPPRTSRDDCCVCVCVCVCVGCPCPCACVDAVPDAAVDASPSWLQCNCFVKYNLDYWIKLLDLIKFKIIELS